MSAPRDKEQNDAGRCLASLLSYANAINASAARVLNTSAELSDCLGNLVESIHSVVSERDALLAVLTEIVYEYQNSYDADCEPGGSWKAAASLPVDLMERAAALVGAK